MPIDEAERWLRENDPDYAETSKGWRDIRGGDYRPPVEEEPAGDTTTEEED